MKKPTPMPMFTDEELALITQGKIGYVFARSLPMVVHTEIMDQLKLVNGQTISQILLFSIAKKTLALHGRTTAIDSPQPELTEKSASVGEFSDDDLIVLAQLERDMEADKIPLVCSNGDGVKLPRRGQDSVGLFQWCSMPIVMEVTEHGPTSTMALLKVIARRNL